jgi:hypothetical protein
MLIYRFITEEDTNAFCHRVTKALVEGWSLHGSPTYAYDSLNGKMRCGQAVIREVEGPYEGPEGRKLGEYLPAKAKRTVKTRTRKS